MRSSLKSCLLVAIVLMVFGRTSAADDIDLFAGVAPVSAADIPNVLIVLDNTANWNNAFVNEIAALSQGEFVFPINP